MKALPKLDWPNLIAGTVLGTIAGGLLGWATSVHFYKKSLEDAKASALEQERTNQLILRGIESIGTITYARDANGNIRDVRIELHANAISSASGSVSLDVTK